MSALENAEIIARNLDAVRANIAAACGRAGRTPESVTLVAITKYVGIEEIAVLRDLGLTDFGENRVHTAQPKIEALGRAVTWRMIGNVQRRKAKDVAALFDWVDAVDRIDLALELDKRSAAMGRDPLPVLLEINVSGEESKHGFSLEALPEALEQTAALKAIDVRGLMTMAPAFDDPEQTRPIFRKLREAADAYNLPVRSMGMSLDYPIAIEEGATHIRVGSALFHGLEGH